MHDCSFMFSRKEVGIAFSSQTADALVTQLADSVANSRMFELKSDKEKNVGF